MTPSLVKGPRVLPDGLLWATPAMMFIAVRANLTRRCLAWTLAGAWFAALGPHQAGLGLVLALFGLSWLVALGATHFAFTGDPYCLAGWWPVRQVLRSALVTAIPALAVGALAWWVWPESASRAPLLGSSAGPPARQPQALIQQLDMLDLTALLIRGVIMLFMTILLIVFLFYLRRYLLRRHRTILESEILPSQVARMEYVLRPPTPAPRVLPGLRGRIVTLWGRWAAVLAREGLGRGEGETAAQYATRMGRDEPALTPPPGLTHMLEQAHYGDAEPTPADLEAMRQYVQEELLRLSLHAQKPAESVEPEE